MNSIKYMALVTMGIVFPFALFPTGCSKSTNSAPATPDPLVRMVTDMNERIDRHDQLMWSDTSFAARHAEMQHYNDDMDRMLDSLGGTLGESGDCHMQIGGHMMGQLNTDSSCPDEAALNDVYDEYHRHFEAMQEILGGSSGRGLIEEMDEHLGQMHEYMETMMQQMDEEYGTRMMMDHDDNGYGHRHDQSDTIDYRGGGHGPGGM